MGSKPKPQDTSSKVPAADAKLQELFYRNLMQHISDSVYFKDHESRFIGASNHLARFFGVERVEDLIGLTDNDFFSADHADQARMDEIKIMETGESAIGYEEKETWPDGHASWALSTKMPLRDDTGKVIGTFGVSKDITRLKQTEEQLRQTVAQLRMHNEMVKRDLEHARVIQRALLPQCAPVHERVRVDFRYDPLEEVGGDYFAFLPLGGGGLGLMVGDLSGHGVAAALFMALIKFISDRLVAQCGREPAEMLKAINKEMLYQLPWGFVTGIYGCLDVDEQDRVSLRLASAGHPRPVLHRASGECKRIDVNGNAAIGLIEEFETQTHEFPLSPRDRVYFFTDGLFEIANLKGEMLGERRLVELIERSQKCGLGQSLDAILAGIADFRGEAEPIDDMLLIGLEVKP